MIGDNQTSLAVVVGLLDVWLFELRLYSNFNEKNTHFKFSQTFSFFFFALITFSFISCRLCRRFLTSFYNYKCRWQKDNFSVRYDPHSTILLYRCPTRTAYIGANKLVKHLFIRGAAMLYISNCALICFIWLINRLLSAKIDLLAYSCYHKLKRGINKNQNMSDFGW